MFSGEEENGCSGVEAEGAECVGDVLGAIGTVEVYVGSIGYQGEFGGVIVPSTVLVHS